MNDGLEREYFVVRPADVRQFEIFELEDVDWLSRNWVELVSDKPMPDDQEKIIVKIIDSIGDFDYLKFGMLSFLSRRVADVISKVGNVQFVEFIALMGSVLLDDPGFVVLHELDRFDAVDYERSDLDMFSPESGGGILTVRKIFLNWNVVGKSELFFLKDVAYLCVSRRIRDEILNIGAKGFSFVSLEDIN